ncbi:(2Fe-2S)-binding protein [Paenibacillus sp. FSL P2-0136]|uniref:(2Fe-2S)-binding protein n=1 Tax=Paenibacillus sp. FSL P2-0136 TaxID=2975317 RepID=UPI0030DC550B
MSSAEPFGSQWIQDFMQQHFALTVTENRSNSFPFSTEDLLDEAKLPLIIGQQSLQLGQPPGIVVGTLFAKRYSVLIMGLAASITLFDTPLSLLPGALRFKLTDAGMMQYEAETAATDRWFDNSSKIRQACLAHYMDRLLAHLRQVLQAVSGYTGAKEKVMWSLIAHNLHNLYGRLHTDKGLWDSEDRGRIISQDYTALLQPEKPDELSMRFKSYEHPKLRGRSLYLRTHCCLAYRIRIGPDAGEYCSTCPKLSPEDRWNILDN